MFTSSLAWTGVFEPICPPRSWIARLAITSLAFMLVCVPEPVCHTYSGNSASSLPSMTSSAARTMAASFHSGSRPASAFTCAAAFFTMPKARTTPRGIRSSPMEKWTRLRWVCAPQ